mmetsp:Transcript_41859/g.97110  ORF Transcript_41859/g.97110 Transcript_41859/m.97110 type:complete len:232 (+) Transcript_41859:207-902(+)
MLSMRLVAELRDLIGDENGEPLAPSARKVEKVGTFSAALFATHARFHLQVRDLGRVEFAARAAAILEVEMHRARALHCTARSRRFAGGLWIKLPAHDRAVVIGGVHIIAADQNALERLLRLAYGRLARPQLSALAKLAEQEIKRVTLAERHADGLTFVDEHVGKALGGRVIAAHQRATNGALRNRARERVRDRIDDLDLSGRGDDESAHLGEPEPVTHAQQRGRDSCRGGL